MKRFIATVLAVLYLSISSGMVMNMHYCMGKLSSVKLAVLPVKKCGCGKMETRGCCRTQVKLVKVDDTHKASVAAYTIQLPVAIPVATLNIINTSVCDPQNAIFANVHAPPPLSGQDTYLQNCVFRI